MNDNPIKFSKIHINNIISRALKFGKKYYVHPAVVDVYKENKMEKYAKKLQKLEAEKVSKLLPLEQLLLKILKKN